MTRFLGINWAPLNVPLERRLQTFWVATYLNLVLPFCCVGITILLLLSRFWYVAALYLAWMVYDVKVNKPHIRGARCSNTARHFAMFKHFCNYFPITLVKTTDLDPSKNYIFGIHPHGIISCGAYGNFGSEATGFSKKFPGLKVNLLTLSSHFNVPISRELLLLQGACDSSRDTVEWILTKKGTGNVAVIVVGGAEEALDSRPGQYMCTVHKRKGFVRLAIKTGTSLVPVFSFGENEVFRQINNPRGSWLRSFQGLFKKYIGLSPPLFYARGFFNYNFGILPFRKPIETVVGAPLEVEKMEEPSTEVIEKYHKLYLEALTELYETHKAKYNIPEEMKLQFV